MTNFAETQILFNRCDAPIRSLGACLHDYHYDDQDGSIWFDVSLKTSTGLDVCLIYRGSAGAGGVTGDYPIEVKPFNPEKNSYSETGYLFSKSDQLDGAITAILEILDSAVIIYFDD